MTRMLAHRGPDGEGFHSSAGAALGHRRLSIIDLAGGAQPMANEDGSVWVILNGEIYNYASLRQDLIARGHELRTLSDTEVLVHLYEERGADLVHELRGMFAFAIWDERRGRLLLARDRLGVKPLVYRVDAEGCRFASELKALLVDESFVRRLDPVALDLYLTYQYVPEPRTIFDGILKLPPAHTATYENGRFVLSRYWRPPFDREEPLDEREYIDQLRATLDEATRLRMRSDVPLGAFLSGGIDSTIVAAIMSRHSDRPIRTYSIGFPVKEFDETHYARLAAENLGTKHEAFVVHPDAVDVLPMLAWLYDEPFADSSAIPTYYVSELTRRSVTVALTGDGGDELFGGYERYQAVALGERFDRLPGWLRRWATASCWQRIPSSVRQRSWRRRGKRLLAMLGQEPIKRYQEWISIFGAMARQEIYTDDFRHALGSSKAAGWLEKFYAELPNRDFLTRTMYVDVNTYLSGDILTKVDIASMAHGLECRGPFLDQEMVALAGRMPASLKLRGFQKKFLLKKAFADLLPPAIRGRGKMGFGVPIDRWLRRELAPMRDDLLLGQRFRERGWLDRGVVLRLIREHDECRWDHSYRLWALLMLELWARNYLDVSSVPVPIHANRREEEPSGMTGAAGC